MKHMYQEGSQDGLPYTRGPVFPKNETTDRIFAFVYLLVGYGFVYMFMDAADSWVLSVYTVFYAVVVLLYLRGKNIHPSKESWFWLGVLLAIGIPFAFWSVLSVFQILALMAVAAYWTLAASGRLIFQNRTSQWVFFDGWNALEVVPFCNFACQMRVLAGSLSGGGEKRDKQSRSGSILLGLVLAVPMLLIILPLLSDADAGFEQIAGSLAGYIQRHLLSIILRMFLALLVSAYLYGLIFGGIHGRNTDRIHTEELQKIGEEIRLVPDTAVCTALAVICLVYTLFMGIQGNYLFAAFTGSLPQNFTYAEYARRGFFELCRIGAWNLMILWLSGMFSRSRSHEHRGLSFFTVLLSVLTLLLIVTAAGKLGLYISVYGLTVYRIVPMIFLIWMAVVFVCMVLRQRREFPMTRICVMAGAALFCLLCIFPVEHWSALYNEWARLRGLIM